MPLSLNTSTLSMVITAPPSLATAAATIMHPNVSSTEDFELEIFSAVEWEFSRGGHSENPYDNMLDPLQTPCWKRWESSVSHWADTMGDRANTSSQGWIKDFSFTASEPCCSSCYYTAGDVQVYHWPVYTTAPSITMLANSDNFTFTYPSVYVAFDSIMATDMCGIVGSAISSVTTIGFDVTELSTAASYWKEDCCSPSNYADIYTTETWWWTYTAMDLRNEVTCTNTTTTIWFDGWDEYLTSSDVIVAWTDRWALEWSGSLTQTEVIHTTFVMTVTPQKLIITSNPCTLFLSIPTRMIQPKWKTCIRNFGGLHDPPILLTPGTGFFTVVQRTSAVPEPTKTKNLSPAQAVQQPSVNKTPPPETVPITSKLPAVAAIGGSAITANANSGLVFGTKTLTPGGNLIISGTTLSMASDGGTLIIDGTSTQVLEQGYTVIRQSLASGWSSVEVYGASVSVKTDRAGGAEGTSVVSQGGTSKAATGVGGAKTSDAEFGAEGHANPSISSRKTKFIYWIAWTVVLCVGVGIL